MPVANEQEMLNLLTEDAFFQGDCLLDDAFFSAVLMPPSGLLAALRAVANNQPSSAYGTVGSVAYDATGTQPDYVCDDPTTINPSWNNCKITFSNGRFSVQSQTFESNTLLKTLVYLTSFMTTSLYLLIDPVFQVLGLKGSVL